jgi:hypothetical protein
MTIETATPITPRLTIFVNTEGLSICINACRRTLEPESMDQRPSNLFVNPNMEKPVS